MAAPGRLAIEMMRIGLLVVVLLLVGVACRQQTTVVGTVVLDQGYVGDVRSARIELHEALDLSDEPVASVLSDDGSDQRQSSFELTDVPTGTYYLLAWRDVDADGNISDRDILGVAGGIYRPGYGGGPIEVSAATANDVKTIGVRAWRDPLDTLCGLRSAGGDTTEFLLSLNYDLQLVSLTVAFPGVGVWLDPDAPGPKLAGVVYRSGGWTRGGGKMPSGRHIVELQGSLEGEDFRLSVPVEIP